MNCAGTPGQLMKVEGELSNDGGVTLLLSPPEVYTTDTVITASVVAAIEPWDSTAALEIIMTDKAGLPLNSLLLMNASSIADKLWQQVEFCMPAGEHRLAFQATWGLNLVPFLAVDDVEVTNRPCVAAPNELGFIMCTSNNTKDHTKLWS